MRMGEKYHVLRVVAIITLCTILGLLYLFVAGVVYENTANKHWQGARYNQRKHNTWNNRAVDSCVQLLKTGDLVVRRGDDMTSYMLAKLNTSDKRYSHCGIAVIESGKAYVYHCIGGEDNPDGKMRRDDARQWFSPANNLSFAAYRYAFPDSVITRMIAQVKEYYRQQKRFDMDFDWQTDDRLYCSEMIGKSIFAATADSSILPLSSGYGKRFLGVDDLYLGIQARLVCQIKFK